MPAIVVDGGRARCRKLRDLKAGDRVVCGMQGIRVLPDLQGRDKPTFGFMSNDVSSERRVEAAVTRVADMLRETRARGGRSPSWPGRSWSIPAAASTSATSSACGFVDVVLSGNALAVHDIEAALSGTSLGIDLDTGRRWNTATATTCAPSTPSAAPAASAAAVASGLLRPGLMHALHVHGVPYVLAGSIRDDGPLPETVMDLARPRTTTPRR